ncbi:MAG: GC-type dockerin domain-anchored protein, partial [Phycisphaerales bacterium]
FRWITRFTPPPPCPADLDGNGTVNGSDLAVLLGAWGGASAVADLNADGVVNASDLAVLLGNWGPC